MTIIISEVLRPTEQTSTSLQKLIREQASLWAGITLGWNEPTLMTIILSTILRRLGEMGEKISSLHFIFCKTAWMKVVPIFFLSQLLLPLRGPITSHIMMIWWWFRLTFFTLQSVLSRQMEWYKTHFSLLSEGNARVKTHGEIHRGIKFSNSLTNFLLELNFQQLFMDLRSGLS